ncbi:MAG: CPXCG motif-containing cysteine-rich protein [Pseudomonadota bacterium]|nr:CPXCG motif-containing cysteine-rich protein [Pseudomonadota bacterium]
MIAEATVTCPACWESIVLDVDLSGGSAEYAEDCPVCCRPMTVQLKVLDDGRFEVDVSPESD